MGRAQNIASLPQAGGVFLGSLAKSTPRIAGASVGALALALGYAWLVSGYISDKSTSVTLNLALVTGQFILLAAAGYVHAMWVGTIAFGSGWREVFLVGSTPRDEEESVVMYSDRTMPFYFLVGIMFALNYVVCVVVTGDYVRDYNKEGYYRTLMRSDDPEDQIRALRRLVDPVHREVATHEEVRGAVVDALRHSDREVRMWAAWVSGHTFIPEARPGLVMMLASEHLDEMSEAAYALARLVDREGERRMLEMLPGSIVHPERLDALLVALGELRSRGVVEPATAMIGLVPETTEAIALWAIGRSQDLGTREILWAAHDAASSELVRCAAAEGLKYVTTVPDFPTLRRLFREAPPDARCAAMRRMERTYKDGDRIVPSAYVPAELLRQKYLIAAFNIGANGLNTWLEDIYYDEEEVLELRLLAKRLLDAILAAPRRVPRE